MSYRVEKKINKRARLFYPSFLEVGKNADSKPVIIKTGPYVKKVVGTTNDSIYMYLQHLQERFYKHKEKTELLIKEERL